MHLRNPVACRAYHCFQPLPAESLCRQCPGSSAHFLALATAAHLGRDIQPDEAIKHYLHAIEHGLLKIMSKMGISTVDAYCGAQIFETIGLRGEVIDRYFTGTASHLDGIGLQEIAGSDEAASVAVWQRPPKTWGRD